MLEAAVVAASKHLVEFRLPQEIALGRSSWTSCSDERGGRRSRVADQKWVFVGAVPRSAVLTTRRRRVEIWSALAGREESRSRTRTPRDHGG